MGIILSAYWKFFQRNDVLDYTPNYVGTWRSTIYPKEHHIRGSIELYLDPSQKTAQALIIYNEQSVYRAGWKVKIDLLYQDLTEDSLASSSIGSKEFDANSKLTLSRLLFRVIEKENERLSGMTNIQNEKKKKKNKLKKEKIDKRFYKVDETYLELNNIYSNLDAIKKEVNVLTNASSASFWNDWPEKELYATDHEWKIIPFKAFDVTIEENCRRFPELWKFISSIPNLKVAIISKLSPGMKLTPHQGWGSHSNHVLRCHFGLSVPVEKACYISVADEYDDKKQKSIDEEIQYHSQDRWMIFDDSKLHYAENPTELDRIVLIVDIDRPPHVKTGTSKVKDTKELMEIVNSFRK